MKFERLKNGNIFPFIVLHGIFLFYSLGGIASKLASGQPFLSFRFCLFYGAVLFVLFVYAILWQQAIKKFPLTVAYSNKAATIVWGMIWGKMFFQEIIKWNMMLGTVIVISGIIIVVHADEK